ncbi:MAG: hypothetical protein OIN66_10340 [Candidatus Methanoperedens sp.]|nr:hypothetical protein [Candidatus Methanoperedens sp.]
MDYWFGNIIEDSTLFKIIEGIIGLLSLVMMYYGIQIALTWKYPKKSSQKADDPQRGSYIRGTVFMFIAGFFMVLHEFLDAFNENAPDYVTYELLELIAVSGVVLFFYEWYKIISKQRP